MSGIIGNQETASPDLYFSDDGGVSFSNWNANIPDPFDNVSFASDWIFLGCAGGKVYRYDERAADLDGTRRVDGGDLSILALAFGTLEGEERYNAIADLNNDGAIDGNDLGILASVWGHRFYYDEPDIPGDFPGDGEAR